MGMDWKSAIKALKAFHAPGLDGSPASMQKELEGLEESLKGWEDRDESRGKSFETWKAVDAKLRAERDALNLQIDAAKNGWAADLKWAMERNATLIVALQQIYKNEGPGLDGSSENASGRIARLALERLTEKPLGGSEK